MNPELSQIVALVTQYEANADQAIYDEITSRLGALWTARRQVDVTVHAALENLMLRGAKLEPAWSLLAGHLLWSSGRTSLIDFNNIWGCSRFAGIHSRFSRYPPNEYLRQTESWLHTDAGPALYSIRGNAYRQLHRYTDAESCYLEGIDRFPGDPFLKFRLVDLCLITYQLDRAKQLLASLRSSYPYALEMMFALPVPADAVGPQNVLPDLTAGDADFVWLVAADPVYANRYGVKFAESVAAQTKGRAHVHFHVVRDPDTAAPTAVIEVIQAMLPMVSSERTVPLAGATPNQRSALFASERFLFLAELLAKYNKPLLVTDIDVECIKNPMELFDRLGDGDIGLTKFGVVRDAWDRYPATAIVVRPTQAAITFFQRLSGMIITLLNAHPQPWFVDQIAIFRLIEEGLTPAKCVYLELLLTDTTPSTTGFFRILHGSWETQPK